MTKRLLFCLLLLSVSATSQTLKIKDYYRLKAGNSWNYAAPPTWKGDYISAMEIGDKANFEGKIFNSVLHFDATKAAKILAFVK